jgi:hypothetical protein
MRPSMLLVLACSALACAKSAVKIQEKADSGAPGRSDAAVDAALPPQPDSGVYFPLKLDVRTGDTGPGQEDGGCSRSVSLRGVTIAQPVPFDVVIVADNSDSLSWSRDSLSAGLRNLLSRVHGHEARFFVLTTTQYGKSSQAAVSPFTNEGLVSWKDSVSGAAYLNEVTTYGVTCVDGKGAPTTCPKQRTYDVAFTLTGTWQFQMPAAVAAITADMDDAAIAVQQKRIADAILALGGGGSQQEQPICTLLRYIGQSASALPKHAVFVVLTDEDDTSPPDVCLGGYEAVQQVSATRTVTTCTSNCTEYQYGMSKPAEEVHIDFLCVPVDDKGTAHPERATPGTLVTKPIAQCKSETTGACSDDELKKAGIECGAGTQVKDCTRACGVSTGSFYCSLSRTDDKIDLCTQPFDEGGVRYTNLADYCSQKSSSGPGWGSCRKDGWKDLPVDGSSASYWETKKPLVTARSTADMIATFKSSADRLIGKGNWSVEAIVLDPSFTCPVNPGQSYATNLRTLASSANDVFPLCQDYAPAVERIASFADYLVQITFPLDLDKYEAVDSVLVIDKKGVQRTVPDTGYEYDRTAKLLRFTTGVLTAQDESLSVNVARYCQSVIP